MRKYLLLAVSIVSFQTAFAQGTATLVAEVSLDSLIKSVREFSGEDSTLVNDTLVRIQHRVSNKGNNLASDYLVDRLTALGLQVEELNYRSKGRNIIATKKGITNPDSIYIISAHYDAVADYCADDNASGSATVLEAARIMNQYCFNNTVKFAFWDEEELGLIGSKYYADTAFAHGDRILGVLNMDMMGYDGDSNKVFDIHTNSDPKNQALQDTLLFVLDTLNIDLVPKIINPGTTRSDHASFWRRGYPAVFCGESFIGGDPNPAYHSVKDRINLFDLIYYHKLAQLAIGTIIELTGVIPTSIERDTIVECTSYTYNDTTFYESVIYRDSLKTAAGCDSVYVLNLTILPVYEVIDTLEACDVFFYRNEAYRKSGLYADTLTSRNGCDSIYIMNLTILPVFRTVDTLKYCEQYIYRGKAYTTSGIYHDVLVAHNGCDSIYTMVLTIWPLNHLIDTIDECDKYVYRGNTYRISGMYHDTLANQFGCDSFYTLDLTIRTSSFKTDTFNTCEDFVYRGKTHSSSGVYLDTLVASNGCDSIYRFDLNITRINDSIKTIGSGRLEAVDTSANYQWVRCSGDSRIPMFNQVDRQFQVPLDDFYAVILQKNQCRDTSDCELVTLTGIRTSAVSQFEIYPNPSSGSITIKSTNTYDWINISVFDLKGVRLSTERFNYKSEVNTLLPSPPGMYIIGVETNDGIAFKKVLKW